MQKEEKYLYFNIYTFLSVHGKVPILIFINYMKAGLGEVDRDLRDVLLFSFNLQMPLTFYNAHVSLLYNSKIFIYEK